MSRSNILKISAGWVAVFFFIFLTTDAEGQKYRKRYNRNTFRADIRLGVKAGANFSTWQGDQWVFQRGADGLQTVPFPVRSYDLSLGYHGGIYADILLKRRFHIQLEAVYARLGSRFETPLIIPQPNSTPIQTTFDTDILVDYLQFPLLFKLGLGKLDRAQFVFGPTLAFKNAEMITYTYPAEASELPQLTSPTINLFEGTDIQAQVGLEIQTDMGINIGLRYIRGFNDIWVEPTSNTFVPVVLDPLEEAPKNYNSSIAFSIGYTLRHYKRLFFTRKGRRFTFKKRRF
ncbi:MAG: outer membrane beta-barrel protein [Flavobacteriales bacterium]|nr:outer membrane beta-barrel protein [Flavobacteriales bacterium]